MKKLTILAAVLAAALLMSGCRQSVISVEEEQGFEPEGNIVVNPGKGEPLTMHPTEAYTIPEGATGPGDVTAEDPQQYYPDSFKTGDIGQVVQIRYYYVNSSGLHAEFGVVEGTEDCTPEVLIQCLVNEGVLAEGTKVTSYEANGDDVKVELNWLVGCSQSATPELLAQAVANTFIDNLNVETVVVKELEGETYGPLEYDY